MNIVSAIEHTNPDFIGSLAKGLNVLKVFNDSATKMTVSDVAKSTDLSRAGARRQLLTLHALGYMKTDGKFFSLSPKVLELGFSYLSSQNWLSTTSPWLEILRDELDESVSVTVLERTEVIYVARFPVNRVMTMSMDIGARAPAFCTAMGRVLLSELPETKVRETLLASNIRPLTPHTLTDISAIAAKICQAKTDGYCIIDREYETSLVALSMPLKNYHGETLGAVNVCGHPASLLVEDLEGRCLDALRSTCQKISQVLV
jgi:IclR family pca regulon transcriptional regulator